MMLFGHVAVELTFWVETNKQLKWRLLVITLRSESVECYLLDCYEAPSNAILELACGKFMFPFRN